MCLHLLFPASKTSQSFASCLVTVCFGQKKNQTKFCIFCTKTTFRLSSTTVLLRKFKERGVEMLAGRERRVKGCRNKEMCTDAQRIKSHQLMWPCIRFSWCAAELWVTFARTNTFSRLLDATHNPLFWFCFSVFYRLPCSAAPDWGVNDGTDLWMAQGDAFKPWILYSIAYST